MVKIVYLYLIIMSKIIDEAILNFNIMIKVEIKNKKNLQA